MEELQLQHEEWQPIFIAGYEDFINEKGKKKSKYYGVYEINYSARKFRNVNTNEEFDENYFKLLDINWDERKIKKLKVINCINCDKEIIQKQKEGILFCDKCLENYKNRLEELIEQIKKDFKTNNCSVKIGSSFLLFNNKSHKHTIFTITIKEETFEIWFETKILFNMVKINSEHLKEFVEFKILSDYYYRKSWTEYNNKIKNNKEEIK